MSIEQQAYHMLGDRQVRRVHLELTTRCNSHCPMCPRNDLRGVLNPRVPLVELTLADIERIMPPDFVAQAKGILFCGNYGDPMVAHDTLEICRYFRRHNPKIQLKMNTNASARAPEWWAELAKLLTTCTFSLDGLEDTNHLYRRGTQWPRIMENVKAFIGAGGRAVWDFIVFRHNEHQVDEARAMSEAMGFTRFQVKKTSRFQKKGRLVESIAVLNRDGSPSHALEIPVNPAYRNEALDRLENIAAKAEYDAYLGETPISCKAVSEEQIYISADGYVFPCCWLGAVHNDALERQDFGKLILREGLSLDAINAKLVPLKDILAGPLFGAGLQAAWDAGPKRAMTCAKICGAVDARTAMYR